jgi:hypothetical protein
VLSSSSTGKHTIGEQASGLSVFPARNKTVKRHLHQLFQVVRIQQPSLAHPGLKRLLHSGATGSASREPKPDGFPSRRTYHELTKLQLWIVYNG